MEIIKKNRTSQFFYLSIIFFSAIFIGMYQVSESGVQWTEDGSRYLNNGAMIRDYLLSDSLFSPYEFAKNNYIKIPGFSVPYHPPGYAFLLGIWFIILGMSYATGRLFIAAMLGITGVFFFKILRHQKVPEVSAFSGALLLVTSHEMVRWGRSTMSELPALAFLMVGSYFFIKWVISEKNYLCWLAFGFALTAFFCRILSAGILPAWFLYLLFSKHRKKCFSIHLILSSVSYFLAGVFWVQFASRFSKNEVPSDLTGRVFSFTSYDNLTIWLRELPNMIGPYTLIVSIICLIILVKSKNDISRFWGFWFLSYYIFQVVMVRIHFESRYFIFALPAFFAFLCSIPLPEKKTWTRAALYISWALILVFNILFFFNIPNGVTGHDSTAQKLSQLDAPGNILISCWNQSDLMFRYRCLPDKHERQLIRGDRTLAIRVSSYARKDPIPLTKNFDDVENIFKQGFIRYMVTTSSKKNHIDDRHKDMILAHETAISNPELFTLLDTTKLVFDFSQKNEAAVYIWRYEGDLPVSKSRLPVVIPTADLEL